jgi:tetratricopeptide (TPR) repeat protein
MNKQTLGFVLAGMVVLGLTLCAAGLYSSKSTQWSFLSSPLPTLSFSSSSVNEKEIISNSPRSSPSNLLPSLSPSFHPQPSPSVSFELSQKTADYYLKKSQEEYKSGNKEEAIKILEEGLKAYPDNELIKSRLDILKKNGFFGF